MGQSYYNTIQEAKVAEWTDLYLEGFPILELRPISKIIFQCSNTYTNSAKSRIAVVQDLRSITVIPAQKITPSNQQLLVDIETLTTTIQNLQATTIQNLQAKISTLEYFATTMAGPRGAVIAKIMDYNTGNLIDYVYYSYTG